MPTLNVGGLLPQETVFKNINARFLNGMRLASISSQVSGQGVDLRLKDPTSNGSLLTRYKQLVNTGGLDKIIAFGGAYSIGGIQNLIRQSGVPNMVVNPGGNLINFPRIKNLHVHSLQQARLNFAAGVDSVSRFGAKGAILSSFYDNG